MKSDNADIIYCYEDQFSVRVYPRLATVAPYEQ